MKLPRSTFPIAALARLAAQSLSAVAQTAPTPSAVPLPGASAPAAKPDKRPATPAEMRDSATAPGDLRPERRVTPQVSIPINNGAPAKPVLTPAPRGAATSSGGVDDAMARCGALADAQARNDCRAKLGR